MDITLRDLIRWFDLEQRAEIKLVPFGPKDARGFQPASAFQVVNPARGGAGVVLPLSADGGDRIISEARARQICGALGYQAPPALDDAEPAGGSARLQEFESFLGTRQDVRTKQLERGRSLLVERDGKSMVVSRETLDYLDVIDCCNALNLPYPPSIAATERESVDTEAVVDAITAANGARVFRSPAGPDGSYTLRSTDQMGRTVSAKVTPDPAGRPMPASEAVRLCRDLDVAPPAVIPRSLRRNDFDQPDQPRLPRALDAVVGRQQQANEAADRAAAAAAGVPYDPNAPLDARPLMVRLVNDNNADRGVDAQGERVREPAERVREERGEHPPGEGDSHGH